MATPGEVGDRSATVGGRVAYLFWLSRPRFWLYLAGPVLVGAVYGAGSPGDLVAPLPVALFAYFLLPANIFLYGVNDVFDADIDAENPKKSSEGKEVRYTGRRDVPVAATLAGLLGLSFFPFLPLAGATAMAGFLGLGAAYSIPPVRFKTTPLLDSVSNGLYVLPAVVAYAVVSGGTPPILAIAGGWVWAMGMHTFSAIPDIEPDRRTGITTTATALGERRTLAYCLACWVLASLLVGLHNPILALPFLLYPAFVGAIVALDIDIDSAYWWFPAINTLAGAVLTMGGIWRLLYG